MIENSDFETFLYISKSKYQIFVYDQSNLKNFYWIWQINKNYNKLNFINNFFSLLNISINSIKKYGGKNLF